MTLGAIGTGLGVLGNMGNGIGLWGNGRGYGENGCYDRVTRHDLDNAMLLAQKDSEIALLKSEQNTEIKIADVYERVMKRVNADKDQQNAINTAQAVYNGTNSSMLANLQGQVHQLYSLTALHIPATNVCPEPMPRYNNWTAPVTAAPAAEVNG